MTRGSETIEREGKVKSFQISLVFVIADGKQESPSRENGGLRDEIPTFATRGKPAYRGESKSKNHQLLSSLIRFSAASSG